MPTHWVLLAPQLHRAVFRRRRMYPFARTKADDIRRVRWDLVVFAEAHRLRNVYKPSNVIGRTLRHALEHVDSKVLLSKPWRYLLVPHDAVNESASLRDMLRFEAKAGTASVLGKARSDASP